jgi:hypothetical protein
MKILIFLFPILVFASARQRLITIHDMDDSIAGIPTRIVMFHKTNGSQVELDTEEFAEYRKIVGVKSKKIIINNKQINLKDYEFHGGDGWAPHEHSFQYFLDNPDPKRFVQDIQKAFPKFAFPFYRQSMQVKEIAWYDTFINTGRGHGSQTIQLGQETAFLNKGKVPYVVQAKNIWTVNHPMFRDYFQNEFGIWLQEINPGMPGYPKTQVNRQIYKMAQESAEQLTHYTPTLSPDTSKLGNYQPVRFFDDDWGTISYMLEHLQRDVDSNLYPNLKIILLHTQEDRITSYVLVPGKKPRTYFEQSEIHLILAEQYGLKHCNYDFLIHQ